MQETSENFRRIKSQCQINFSRKNLIFSKFLLFMLIVSLEKLQNVKNRKTTKHLLTLNPFLCFLKNPFVSIFL